MSSIKTAYDGDQAITITLASLADSSTAGRESLLIANSSLYLDALVTCQVKTQNSGTISAPSTVFVYAAASIDGGSAWPDAVTGADAAITLNNPTQLRLLGAVYFASGEINTTRKGGPWSVAALYGGRMPENWSVVVVNDSGTALSATGGDHVVSYQGVYATVT